MIPELVIILLTTLFCVMKILNNNDVFPVKLRFFVEQDPSLSYPKVNTQVSNLALYLISCLIPLFVFILILMNSFKSYRHFVLVLMESFHFYHQNVFILRLLLFYSTVSFFVTNIITDVLKLIVGRLRPSFYALCNYAGYNDAMTSRNFTTYFELTRNGRIGDFSKCLEKNQDAQYSFPSGHASTSFVGMMITGYFIFTLCYIVSKKYSVKLKTYMGFTFLLLSLWIAITRVQDYRHHTDDIIAGSLIGIIVPVIVFNTKKIIDVIDHEFTVMHILTS